MDLKCQFLSRDEERVLMKKALAGDIAARNQIVMSFWPLIWRKATGMAKRHGQDPDDLVNIGIAHVLRSFHLFNPRKGFRASTYFVRVAWAEMWRFCQYDGIVYSPIGGKITPKYREAVHRTKSIDSLNRLILNGDGQTMEAGAALPDKSTLSQDDAEMREDARRLHQAIRALPNRLQVVIERRMRGESLRAIGKAMGISKERVRQLETKARARLVVVLSRCK